jgi:excisionase family DNA binding protein
VHRKLPDPPSTETRGASAGPRISGKAQRGFPAPPPLKPAWLSVAQLGRRWQLDRRTIYKFIDSGILPAWKIGSHLYRISVADTLRFEAQNALQADELAAATSKARRHDVAMDSGVASPRPANGSVNRQRPVAVPRRR